MKQLPCIKRYVLIELLKSIIARTNTLTDMNLDDSFYPHAYIDLQ